MKSIKMSSRSQWVFLVIYQAIIVVFWLALLLSGEGLIAWAWSLMLYFPPYILLGNLVFSSCFGLKWLFPVLSLVSAPVLSVIYFLLQAQAQLDQLPGMFLRYELFYLVAAVVGSLIGCGINRLIKRLKNSASKQQPIG